MANPIPGTNSIQAGPDGRMRCAWCLADPLYIAYHDQEWGIPVRDDDRHLFEMLTLESAQAGLSWLTILKRREGYRRAYKNFHPEKVARFGQTDIQRLLADPGIIRNRLKVTASINNAARFIDVQKEFGSFSQYFWSFVGHKSLVATPRATHLSDLPCQNSESKALSKDLIRRGFRFVGPVICYSWMQACGLVDDHLDGCFRCGRK